MYSLESFVAFHLHSSKPGNFWRTQWGPINTLYREYMSGPSKLPGVGGSAEKKSLIK